MTPCCCWPASETARAEMDPKSGALCQPRTLTTCYDASIAADRRIHHPAMHQRDPVFGYYEGRPHVVPVEFACCRLAVTCLIRQTSLLLSAGEYGPADAVKGGRAEEGSSRMLLEPGKKKELCGSGKEKDGT